VLVRTPPRWGAGCSMTETVAPETGDDPPEQVEVFADVLCPFTHVGLRRLVDRRRALGRTAPLLVVRAWPLELVNGQPLAADFVGEEVAELRASVAPDLFTGFDPARFPSSALPALGLAARARRAGPSVGERCSLALRHALFEEGRDIADSQELARIADECGIDGARGEDQAAVLADLELGRSLGVIGSPHFFVGGEGFFCPSLDIERVDGRLEIRVDAEGFAALADRCFGPADA
jgi:predicted DsbA family dithiol-disulfide isomerase